MKIFISHSHKDKTLIDKFVEKILILGCGLNDSEIFCTSIEGLGIKTGEDFREHVKKKLLKSDYSFIFISNDYKKSEICLNEMGASWAIDDKKVKPFIFPNLDFSSLGTLFGVKQGAKINDSFALDELHEEIKEKFKTDIKLSRWNKHKGDFLNFQTTYFENKLNNIFPSPKEYFSQFIQENVSLNHILLKAHPTLLDCKVIFSKNYYRRHFEYYCQIFENLEKELIEPLYPKKKAFRIIRTTTSELLYGINNIAGAMVDCAQKGAFNYDIDFYRVTFLESEKSEAGISYKVFCYVNERWVFIPKPWSIKI